jgi:biotin carboxyl carrier protein
MRIGRLFLGLVVILFALSVIVGEQITGVSSDAVINARLSTLRTPIAGTLDMPFIPFGTVIHEGEELASLNDPLVDVVRRDDLRIERAFAEAEIARLVSFGAYQTVAGTTDPEVLANRSPRTYTRIGGTDIDVYLSEAQSRLAAIDVRLVEENARIDRLTNARLTAPTNGRLWEVLADDGEIVSRGEDILKLMVCDSALVTLSVPDNIYNQLRVDQPAKFRLDGTETLYDGTITRMAGAGAESIYRNLAVAPSIKHLERYDVALLVPGLRENSELRCTVGQTGRVFFETRPLDWVRDLLN